MTSDRERLRLSVTHRLAAEIHGALADRAMSIKELSTKIGESEAFIRRILVAEDSITEVVKLGFLADVAWATSHSINVHVSPETIVKLKSLVKRAAQDGDA
jgi:hypothetical protein